MSTNTTNRPLVWIGIAIVATLIVLPLFGMMGTESMMGGMWGDHMWGASGASSWMPIIGVGLQLLFLAVIAAAIYFGYRAVTQDASADSALEELRIAYARGDLSDDEYERRREQLETKL